MAPMHNVSLVYVHTCVAGLAHQLCEGAILTQWIFAVAHDTRANGLAKGSEGLSLLAASMVFGLLVDGCPRNVMLRSVGGLGVAVSAVLAALVFAGEAVPVQLWYAALALQGASSAGQTVALESVFADSVSTGARVRPYLLAGLLKMLVKLLAAVLQAAYFAATGSKKFTMGALRPMMLSGFALSACAALLVTRLDHRRTLGAASEVADELSAQPRARALSAECEDSGSEECLSDAARDASPLAASGARAAPLELQAADEAPTRALTKPTAAAESRGGGAPRGQSLDERRPSVGAAGAAWRGGRGGAPWHAGAAGAARVRWLLLLLDVTHKLALGVGVSLLPLYFSQQLHQAPLGHALMQVNGFALGGGALVGSRWLCAQRRLPRGPVCLGMLLLHGASCLLLAAVPSLPVAFAANGVREASHDAFGQLKKTLQMDHVPKRMRGRWNATDALLTGVFHVAAVLGGLLAHAHGYQAALLASSAGLVAATLVFVPLVGIR